MPRIKKITGARAPLTVAIVSGDQRSVWTLPVEQVWRRGVARRVVAGVSSHFGGRPYGDGWAIFAEGDRKLTPLIDSVVKEAHFRGWALEARPLD